MPPAPEESPGLLTLTVDDLTREGQGLGRHQGQVILVDGALPGDLVQVRLIHRGRRHAVGQLLRLLTPSPERRRPPCILADHCGGCTLQHLSDQGQQHWKHTSVAETLRRLGGITTPIQPLWAAPQGLGYRNRAVIPLERDPHGKLRAGYYRRGSHQIVNLNRCPVLDPRLDAMIQPLKADLDATAWPVDRHAGAADPGAGLRHLALRIGRRSGERLLTLIASHSDLPGIEDLAQRWLARWPELVGVTLNLQPEPGNRLFGAHTITIQGRPWLNEPFAGVQLHIGADTFFQVYSEQAEHVVELLLTALGPPGGTIVEGYCGIGTFSLPLARAGWTVLGLEQHGATVALARANAQRNGLNHRCDFRQGDGALLLEDALSQQLPSAVLVDPPRKGLAPAATAALLRHRPPRILYLSCDPATLARDLKALASEGPYSVIRLQPLDFFPNTSHVETLAQLHLDPNPSAAPAEPP
ncbi:MAG: 23S rRNA (uracil(1939)-C(5))-methyltransferase RlmD [Cyanobacteriota bacterium]|nr:23S rRNA (uracil(1939)-C(5))-methyltransferase RlmD [Cyanobacteriota bacterium]